MSATYRSPVVITVTSRLHVTKAALPASAKKFLREKLFILNSEYIIKERLGHSTYDTPKFFDLIDEQDGELLLPRGFLSQLMAFLDKEDIAYEVIHRHPQFAPLGLKSGTKLLPEQEKLVEQAFAAGQGILVAPPGSGKTIMGLALAAKHDKPALILTHRKQLLDQWVEQIQAYFGMPKRQIGRFSSAYKKPSDYITVGLLQSFARAKDISELANAYSVIIIDECHHIPARTFRNVLSQLNAQHIYGLTATPKRKHNDEKLIYLYIGDIVASMNSKPAKLAPQSDTFAITVQPTELTLPFDWKTDQAELLAKVICYDTARNQQIVNDVVARVNAGRRVLVLSERKEHLKILELYLRGSAKTLVFSGDDSAVKRTEKLQQIAQGEYEVLLATGQLFGEGVHAETIETLVLAFPFAFEGKLVQYVGRLAHSAHAHELIDYRDGNVKVLEEQYKQRARHYKKLGKLA